MTIDHDRLRQRIQAIIDADKDLSVRSVSLASGSDSWLHKFMTSDASMKLVQLNKLSEALGVSSEWLLFGNQDRVEISAEELARIADEAADEIEPGMPIGLIRRSVSSRLRALLEQLQSQGVFADTTGEEIERDKAFQSPAPTKPA